MPTRINPIAKYLFALSAVIVAYCAYIKLAVPLLEGPPHRIARQAIAIDYPDVTTTVNKSHLPSIVPADAWELGSCKTLLTPQGTIYFEYWEPVDDQGTYKLMPFTMVVNDPVNQIRSTESSPAASTAAPIVLRSLEGARLRFTKPLTARSQKEDIELDSALLDGQVTLFRPANEQGEQELRLVSHNIQINRSQIFTLSDVHFSFGGHHGSGRNLSIQLTHDTVDANRSFSSITGVEQMELASISELVLKPTGGTPSILDTDNTPEQSGADAAGFSLTNQKSPLQISCDGPFVFQMAQQKAWFRDKVVVTQLDQYRDRLECTSLQIDFVKRESETSVEKLIAIGSPDEPATITSNSQQTMVRGEELIYEVANSIVKAAGSKPVSIQSPTFAIESPTLRYQLAKQGKLGGLVAEGPGILRAAQEGRPTEPFEVSWNNQLTTRNLDEDRIQIDIDDRASVSFNHRNGIWADRLRFVLWQLPNEQKPAAVAGDSGPAAQGRWQYQPSNVVATGNVLLKSPQVTGFTKELIANWPSLDKRAASPERHTVSYRYGQLVGGQVVQRGLQREDFRALPDHNAEPALHFQGDKVIANVQGDLGEMRLRDLLVDGSLVLENKAQDQRPFVITGQSMKLVPQLKDRYRVTIDGRDRVLATFKTDGFNIQGRNLQLDQSANTIWVDGAGDLEFDPGNLKNLASKETPDIDGAQVSWQGGMVFDGSKIYFEHQVELLADRKPNADGSRSRIKSNCEALTFELSESIQLTGSMGKEGLANGGTMKDSGIEIKRMVFVNEVNQTKRAFRLASHRAGDESAKAISDQPIEFQNATLDPNGKIATLQKLRVPMASVESSSGDIVTKGPGEAMIYQYGNGASPLAKIGGDQPKRTTTANKKKLTCVHTRFDGALTASMSDGKMEVERNTRSAWGDVKSFEQSLDPDEPTKLPVGAAVLKADVLKMARWTPRDSPERQELHAIGNTSIRSDLFEAVADRMTYTDVTDVLVIEGRPPADARLSYRRNTKARPETLRAAKVMYRLSDQWTDVFDIRSVDAGLPGGN